MDQKQTIETFYTAFANNNHKGMTACYHKNIIFRDPVFGIILGDMVVKMWEMLLTQKKGDSKITFSNIETSGDRGKALWEAEYFYGPKKRKVINKVSAEFKFKDGKIIEHTDSFDLWKWTRQALGFSGYIMGWTAFIRNKIQTTTNQKLNDYISRKKQ